LAKEACIKWDDMAEPTILGATPAGTTTPANPVVRVPRATSRPASRGTTAQPRLVVTVAGFWRRVLAAGIDGLIVFPAAFLLAWLAGKLAGVSLPDARHTAPDYWLDLAIAGEPALWGTIGLVLAIAVIYLFLFHMTVARTLGMRVCKLRVIDVYGEPPSVARAALRTLGYLASAATLGLGFVWVGFDAEKRGLHDWIAGTYVIRSEEGAGQG
jgi:uncharacterized RDD family membrane protein YckC